MNNEIISIERLIICAFEVFMLCSFIESFFERCRRKTAFVFGYAAVTLIIFIENGFGLTVLNLFSVPVFYIGFVLYADQITVNNAIVYGLIYFIIFVGAREVAFEMLYRMCASALPIYIPPWFEAGSFNYLVVEDVLGYLFLLYIKRHAKNIKINHRSKVSWWLLIMPISTLLILSSFVYMDFPTERPIQYLMCGGAILLYFSNATVFIILEKLSEAMEKVKHADLCIIKEEMEKKSFESLLNVNEQYQNRLHDTRHYINSMQMLAARGDLGEIKRLLEDMKGKLNLSDLNLKNKIYIKNPIMNSILMVHTIKAAAEGVLLSIYVEPGLSVEFISDSDIISIFSNLLENSIEAAAKCAEGNKKVNLRLRMANDEALLCHIVNSHMNEFKKEGKRFLTTKKEKGGHGLGIGIVSDLAKKYNGVLVMEDKGEGEFSTLLYLFK